MLREFHPGVLVGEIKVTRLNAAKPSGTPGAARQPDPGDGI
jgi:hypothetical protein